MEAPLPASSIRYLEQFYAIEYGLPAQEIEDIVSCESGGNQFAKGDYTNGIPTSFGLVQLHNLKDKGLEQWQAYSPLFSLDYLAYHLSIGKGSMWSCYKKTGWNNQVAMINWLYGDT